jgi:Flp pilus assembly protein TadD
MTDPDPKPAAGGAQTPDQSTGDPTEGLELEFVDAPAASTEPSARPVARVVPRKTATAKPRTRRTAKAVMTKSTPADPAPKSPAAKPAAEKTTGAKRPSRARPVAKAVVKAAPKKPAETEPVPDPTTEPAAKTAEAEPAPPRIVARPAEDTPSLMRRALRAHNTGRLDEAAGLYQRILHADPAFAPAWINLGVLLRRTGKAEAAVMCLRRGVALEPEDGAAWSNLGNALRASNRLDDALSAQRRALDLSPGVARVHYNFGLTVRDKGDLSAAEHAMHRAELLGYDTPELAWDQALTKLLAGDLRAGFPSYESRWRLPEAEALHQDIPEWDGSPLAGRTLLVWAEQGLGDTIQFARYLCDSAAPLGTADGRVILEVQPPLARVLQRSADFSGITIVPRGAKLPPADLQIPLLSLPRLARTDRDSIPDHCPYITSPPEDAAPNNLQSDRLKVGICWAGKPSHRNDRNRSVPLSGFGALFDLPGTDFLSLQKGPAAAEIEERAIGALVRDLGTGFRDFADTAAALRALDLVITVDTSVAHLAGAMARPVWVLLPYAPDWRWMLHRDDSPWYPSMTLFRQTSPGDWDEVFTRVRHALIRKLRGRFKG